MTPAAGWYTDPGDGTQVRWWDGQRWTTATQSLPWMPAPATGVRSSFDAARAGDGFFAGTILPDSSSTSVRSRARNDFAPTSRLIGAAGYTKTTASQPFSGIAECQVCGASPARVCKFSSLRGLIIIFVARTHRGRWCRDCAQAQFRNAQNFTLAWGWWGLFTLFLTPIAALLNLSERGKARRLGPPTNRRAAPLMGAPLSRRPGIWISAVIVSYFAVAVALGR